MGGRGSAANRNSGASNSPQERFVGKRVSDFANVRASEVEEMLGLTKLTQGQKDTLARMLRGSAENDYSYDEGHTPYRVHQFSITKVGEEFSSNGTAAVSVLFTTKADSGRPNVDWMDYRTRLFIIGKKGGAYTYNNNGKRKNIKDFTVRYGSLD